MSFGRWFGRYGTPLLLLVILFIVGYIAVDYKFGLTEKIAGSVSGGAASSEPLPPVDTSKKCYQQDIGVEYAAYFTNLQVYANSCKASGVYVQNSNEVSCMANTDIEPLNCDSLFFQQSRALCQNTLGGSYVCDNTNHIYGCWKCGNTVPTTNPYYTVPAAPSCTDNDGNDPLVKGFVLYDNPAQGIMNRKDDACRAGSNTLDEAVCPFGNTAVYDCVAKYNKLCFDGACRAQGPLPGTTDEYGDAQCSAVCYKAGYAKGGSDGGWVTCEEFVQRHVTGTPCCCTV